MTHVPGRLLGVVLAFAAIAVPAAAQDDPRFALVTSFPSPTVSFQWEVSARFAFRVEGSYNYRDESSDTVTGRFSFGPTGNNQVFETVTHTESTSHGGSIGVAGIFTIHRNDQLRLYVAPRVSLALTQQRITFNTTVDLPTVVPGGPSVTFGDGRPLSETVEYSSTSPAAGVAFGAATNVHRRLALFGEAGFTWSRSDLPLGGIVIGGVSSLSDIESKRTIVNTRAVGGVMLLF